MVKEIPLTQGKITLVDDEDYKILNQHKCQAAARGKIFYAQTGRGKNHLYLHRIILGAKKGEYCDHINGDGLDNRRSNLRIVSNQENSFNKQKKLGFSSKYRGVFRFDKWGWEAQIHMNYKSYYLGLFETEEEAARAFDAKAIELRGVYAKTNFVYGDEKK